jgi:glycerol-3-phosphate dehydrogenase (NAD(P)+)
MDRIAVIGAGTWGTTLAKLLADKGYEVSLWIYEKDLFEEIRKKRVNTCYLPGVLLPDTIRPSLDLEEVLQKADYIVNAIPTQYTREVFNKAVRYIPDKAIIVSTSKGIEKGTLMTVSGILEELSGRKVAVLSGPSFAKEVVKKLPAAVTVATESEVIGQKLQKVFNTDYFRVYTNTDVLGVELGGALKNVMAIAAGISDGLGLGANARAALITRGLAEMTRLGVAMGAKEKTFWGLSGLGDLVLTCTGTLSRNHTVGFRLGRGEELESILSGMTMVAEGVATSESALQLSRKFEIEMPIVEQIHSVLYKGKDPLDAVKELMTRSLKAEY